MKNLQTFLDNSKDIVDMFNKFVLENELQEVVIADHVCYKCDSNESYEEWRKMFETESKSIYQAVISKRRIAIITFKKPIKTLVGDINYLELSDQKPDNSQKEGFDHVEFFPNGKKIIKLRELLKIFKERKIKFVEDVKPHITQYIIDYGEYNFRLAGQKVVDKIKLQEFI